MLFAIISAWIPGTSSSDVASAATPKVGASCKKLNSVTTYAGVKYQCVKSGSKLVLKRLVVAPSYYIPPKPKSSKPITFANIKSRIGDIPKAAFDSLQETKARNASLPGAKIQINIVRGEHVNGTFYDNTENWIKEEAKALANFARFKKVYIFEYAFEDQAWAQSQMDSLLNDSSIRADRIYGGQTCQQANRADAPMVANITNGWDRPINPAKPMEQEIPYVLAGYCGETDYERWAEMSGTTHELGHQYQVSQFWDKATNIYPKSGTREPCWMGEGLAGGSAGYSFETNFSQFAGDLKRLPKPYYLNSAMTSTYEPAPSYWGPLDVKKYLQEASTDLPGCRSTNRFALSYSLGSYAVLSLSAIGGWESVWSLLPMLNDGISLNDAFKRVYGITWDQALPTLSEVVSALVMRQLDPPGYATYHPTNSQNIVSLTGEQLCAAYKPGDPQTTRARIQVLQNGHWLDVPTIKETWAIDPSQCQWIPDLPWVVTLKVALDPGASYRFLFLGQVNIGQRDEFGRGFSQTFVLP